MSARSQLCHNNSPLGTRSRTPGLLVSSAGLTQPTVLDQGANDLRLGPFVLRVVCLDMSVECKRSLTLVSLFQPCSYMLVMVGRSFSRMAWWKRIKNLY